MLLICTQAQEPCSGRTRGRRT